jgi:uncharacterized membrane protein
MKKLFAFLFVFLFLLIKPQFCFAEIIHSFDTSIIAHKDGAMDVTETINYDFENESRHGIYRDIPLYSAVGDLYRIIQIKNINVLRDSGKENFSLSNNSSNLNIKIGNANKTINGSHIYTISYKVINGIGSNFEDHDEIYWNVTGNNWEVNIEKASVRIETDFDIKLNKLICFEGSTGTKNQTCNVVGNFSNSSQILYPGSGLTVVAVYPVNTFPKSILSKNPPQSIIESLFKFIFSNYIYILIALNFVLAPYLIYWYQKHKNKKRFGSSAVNFDIPKDDKGQIIRPALAGTIDNATLGKDDLAATIFDLAIRKYIRLEEVKTAIKFFPDLKDQKIIKLKNSDENLNSYEKRLFYKLFEDGDSVNISTLKGDFYKTFSEIEKDVFEILVEKKYYTKNPKVQKIILMFLAFLCFFSANIILSIILFFLSFRLNGRTPLGDEIDFKIDGLKIFLKSMDRNYKWQAEKFYTVEEMIPYAMAFGFIDKFMKQLKIIKPDYNPTWYGGYRGSFYASYAVLYSGMTTSMAPPSSSGSSGGFSGGGGGGGGGGSW